VSEIPFEDFQVTMATHGLLMPLPFWDSQKNRWRLSHLLALAALARVKSPELTIDGSLTPERLYEALSAVIKLDTSAVFTLEELLGWLEKPTIPDRLPMPGAPPPPDGLPPFAVTTATPDIDKATLSPYRKQVLAAIRAANAAHPERVDADRALFAVNDRVSLPPPSPVKGEEPTGMKP
jgi:hypothetical protein